MADALDYALDIREGRTTLDATPKKLRPQIALALRHENRLLDRAKERAAARQPSAATRMVPVHYLV